jgi:hypothetical protein
MKEHIPDEHWNYEIAFKEGYGIIHPSYTHWTVAYALTLDGILLYSKILSKFILLFKTSFFLLNQALRSY